MYTMQVVARHMSMLDTKVFHRCMNIFLFLFHHNLHHIEHYIHIHSEEKYFQHIRIV